MPTLKIDTATIYQIYWLSHSQHSRSEIAQTLGISRNSVAWHLSGRMLHLYPDSLRRRIAALKPTCNHARNYDTPTDWISLDEASYFFPTRPKSRRIGSHYCKIGMRSEIVKGQRLTKKHWARHFVLMHFLIPTGICLTPDALAYIAKTGSLPHKPFYRVAELPLQIQWHASAISFALSVQTWTGLPFVTLSHLDLLRSS